MTNWQVFALLLAALAAISLLASARVLPPGAVVSLLGVWLGHAGLTAYNSVKANGKANGNGEKRQP